VTRRYFVAWALLALGCTPSVSQFGPGLHLQLRVADAQLHEGRIRADRGGPEVSQLLRPQPVVSRGDDSVQISGRLAPDGVALHIQAVGDPDHWVLPTKGYDFVVGDELQFNAKLGFSHAIQTDELRVRLAASDKRGRLGPVTETSFVMAPDMPAAHLLVSLAWDAPADVDLHVVDADGVVIGAKNIAAFEPPAGVVSDPDAYLEGGYLEFDSNKQCRLDLMNREQVVWLSPPPSGRYRIFAHLYSPCDTQAVNMIAVAHYEGEVVARAGATQYPFDAREHFAEGEAPGLFLTDFDVP
jgi:hypothetical protein